MSIELLKNSLPDLHQAVVSETELDYSTFEYSRPLNEYPTANEIANYIQQRGKKHTHVYSKDLRVGGTAVQDSFEKYLGSEHLGSSTIKSILKTPMHFAFQLDGDKKALEKLNTKANHFNLGTFIHQAILEPTKFKRVVVEPKYSLTSKDGVESLIEFWQNHITEQGFGVDQTGQEIESAKAIDLASEEVVKLGLTMAKMDGLKTYYYALKSYSGIEAVTEEHFLKIQIIKRHIDNYADGILYDLLKGSKREISLYHTDEETGVKVKVRPDAMQFEENIGANTIISVKSSACEDLKAFYTQAAKLHYDLSEGMYQEVASKVTGRDFNCTITIMIQTVEPYTIALLVWSPVDIEVGKYKYRTALQRIQKTMEDGFFKGYDTYAEEDNCGLIEMELPQWNNQDLLSTNI